MTPKTHAMRIPCSLPSGRRRMSGIGLIEVLIAIVILAFGLLGIAAMQATTLRNSQSSLERSQAVVQSYAVLDRMRANRDAALIGSYDLIRTCNPPDGGTLIADDQRQWIQTLKASLGTAACGTITCGSLDCAVTVDWDDSRGNQGSTREALTTRTRL